ncbi:hypothetical protein GCM10020255_101310 [Rhodococcus baikonurensis]
MGQKRHRTQESGCDDGKADRQSQLRANETANHGVTDFGLFLHLHPGTHDPSATALRQHNALTLRGSDCDVTATTNSVWAHEPVDP